MTTPTGDKVGRSDWDALWGHTDAPPPIDPSSTRLGDLYNRRLHRRFDVAFTHLPNSCSHLLEIGCGRSAWLPYFATQFGFSITGLDYSELGCEQERALLRQAGVAGNVVCADLFTPPAQLREAFDVIVSLGVVEHFTDTARCLAACADLLRPGGTMVTIVPNMTGLLGHLQRSLDRAVYDSHVPLTCDDLAHAHTVAGLEVKCSEYFLSTGFGILRAKPSAPKMTRLLLRAAEASSIGVWALEEQLFHLPAGRRFSPFVVCEARRPDSSAEQMPKA